MESKNNPVFILSGMSGTGKSFILELARWYGIRPLKSFNKFLLDIDFGYGVPTKDYLIMNQLMQAYHIQDYEYPNNGSEKWIIERSIIDGYFYRIKSDKKLKLTSEYRLKISHIIEIYFNLVSSDKSRPIVIIDILNNDKTWIETTLNENKFRKSSFGNVSKYLEWQDTYKEFYFSTLDRLGIPYTKIPLVINDVTVDFTKSKVEKFVLKYMVK